MSQHYSPGFPGEPPLAIRHKSQTPTLVGSRTCPCQAPPALTCWVVALPRMARKARTVSEGRLLTTRDSRTTSRT